MQNDIQVTALNIPDNAPIEKGRDNGGRTCFVMRGTFTLADGRTVPTRVTSERKKNLATAIQRERESIAAGSMTHDPVSGMTTTRFTIGSRGLQPFAGHPASGIPAVRPNTSENHPCAVGSIGVPVLDSLDEPHRSDAQKLLASAGAS